MSVDDFDREERPAGEGEGYRPLSALALVAVGLAVLSLISLLDEFFGFLALLSMVVAGAALRRIHASDPPMLGRRLAQFALAVSLISAVGGVTNSYAYRLFLDQEARQIGETWFDWQLNGHTELALTLLGVKLDEPDTSSQAARTPGAVDPKVQIVEQYLNRPEVKLLLDVGRSAQVRYYDTETVERKNDMETVQQNYAVTYDKEGAKTVYYIQLTLARLIPTGTNVATWRVAGIKGGVTPKSLETSPPS